MTEAMLCRAQELYGEARDIVAEEVKLRQRSSRHIVRLAAILRDLYHTFQQREDPREGLVLVPKRKGFADFREAMLELLRPLDLGERIGWYYLSIGRYLVAKVPESQLADMGFAKVKELARVAKAKREVPAQLIEHAKDPEQPASKLQEEVDLMHYRGAPDHSDGPLQVLRLVGGKGLIASIKEKIERLRPAATEDGASQPASDAQVVDYALADCLAGIQEEEDHVAEELTYGKGRAAMPVVKSPTGR